MIGLELCKEAVEDAQYNARENGEYLEICTYRCTCARRDTWIQKWSTCQQSSPSNILDQQYTEEEPAKTWRAEWQRPGRNIKI